MDMLGRNLGKYKILEKIGGGGMGNVFLAEDTILDRKVALKLLAPSLAADTSFVERFLLEARSLARLDHPAIVRVFDADWADDQIYLVMEYVPGGSLADIIKEEGALPPELVNRLLTQVAEGLDYAHSRGMVHRDIKPANILIDQSGQAQITDFGLVKDAETSLTADGQRLGTPAYMAPEQIQGQTMGPAVDIYALGIVTYEMLTGRPPFQGTLSSVFEGHLLREPPPLRQFNPRIPPTVQDVVLQALAKAPAERFGSAISFIQAFQAAYDALDDQAATVFEQGAREISSPPAAEEVHSGPASGPASPAAGRPASGPQSMPSGSQPGSGPHPAGPPQKRRRGLLGLGAVGIGGLVLIAGLCLCAVLGFAFLGAGGSLASTSTPPPTRTPAPTDTPLPRPEILYQDDFSNPAESDWTALRDQDGITDYDQGGYRIRVDIADWIFWTTVGDSYEDVSIEVDATKIGGPDENEFGLICRYMDRDNFYYFVITSDGLYGIIRRLFGEREIISGEFYQSSSAINQGDASNRLRADCDGLNLRLWVNGVLVDEVLDPNISAGNFGLIAGTTDVPGADILFDNLLVTEAQPANP